MKKKKKKKKTLFIFFLDPRILDKSGRVKFCFLIVYTNSKL